MSETKVKGVCDRCGASAYTFVELDDLKTCPVCLVQKSKEHDELVTRYYTEQEQKIQEQYTEELQAAHGNFRTRLENLLEEVANIITEGTGNDPR